MNNFETYAAMTAPIKTFLAEGCYVLIVLRSAPRNEVLVLQAGVAAANAR